MTLHTIPTPNLLRQAALRRNLRTAAVLGLAISGGLVSSSWLAATAGGSFLVLTAWRYRQLRRLHPETGDRS